MKILLMTAAFFILAMTRLFGQEIIDTTYYKSKYGGPEVSEKQGKVIELTVKMPDGSICYKMTDKKGGKVLRQRCYRDDIPTGIWISITGTEIDYNIEISYKDTIYADIPYFDLKEGKLISELSGNFEPPIFPEYENHFQKYIAMNLRYPEIAAENGIQGKVFSQFIIDESGTIKDLRIKKSADKVLDIEAARVILQSTKWTPAKLDGKPIKVCISIPTNFILQ